MNIADLSTKGNQPYFMEDTIHLGWRGWLAADEYIQPFLDSKVKENRCMKSTIIFSKIGSKRHQKIFRGNEKGGLLENRNAGGFIQ